MRIFLVVVIMGLFFHFGIEKPSSMEEYKWFFFLVFLLCFMADCKDAFNWKK